MSETGLLPLWLEVIGVGVLIVMNGFFAAAEIALISARRSRVQQLAGAGDARAGRVLRLQDDPDRFLATVQVGVTFVGTLASAVGGAAAVRALSPAFREIPIPGFAALAEPAALAVTVVGSRRRNARQRRAVVARGARSARSVTRDAGDGWRDRVRSHGER